MRTVLILDTETSGLEADAACLEVGVILYSVAHTTTLTCFSSLIHALKNPAEPINRIPEEALRAAPPAWSVWEQVEAYAAEADAFLAHNAEFDQRFVPVQIAKSRPWICTKFDLAWPQQTKPGGSLVPLALEHDLGVAVAHRALADCELIARLLTRTHELGIELVPFLMRGLRPKVTLMAEVSYDDREKAKAQGFQWHAQRKQWLRRMVEEDAAFEFPVRVVKDEIPM